MDSKLAADAHEDADFRAEHRKHPDLIGASAIIHCGDRLEFASEADGTTSIVVVSDGQPWYRLRLSKGSHTLFAVHYLFEPRPPGQQSGSGHQPTPDNLRTTGFIPGEPDGPADGDHPSGRAAGVPGPTGESGRVPDYDPDCHVHPFVHPATATTIVHGVYSIEPPHPDPGPGHRHGDTLGPAIAFRTDTLP